MSIPNDLSAYEKMNNMKNMLGGSFIEYLKGWHEMWHSEEDNCLYYKIHIHNIIKISS